jgi:hypothetical protein
MKGRRHWHKRYHNDALNGYMGLTPAERGIYTTCLDLIYSRGTPLAWDGSDGERWLAGWCGCSTRLLRPVIQKLIEKGKLRLLGGMLSNERAMSELGRLEELSDQRAEASHTGGLASGVSRREEEVSGSVQPRFGFESALNQPRTEPEPGDVKSNINNLGEANAKQVREARSQRLESTSAPEFSVMQAKLAARLPKGCMWPLRNALDLKPIYACLEGGADFERHVLPAVEAEAKCAFDGGRKIGSWARFQTAIMAAVERDRLTAAPPKASRLNPEDRERAHRMTLKRYVAEPATWPPGMGPRPGEAGCIISADLLAEFNIHAAQAA